MGPRVLRGRGPGRFQDVSRASGLFGDYAWFGPGWLRDLDGDGLRDLLTVDGELGVRTWKGLPDIRFEARTREWMPGPPTHTIRGAQVITPRPPALLEDLDGDGTDDLLACLEETPCRLWAGVPTGGFIERSAALPADVTGVVGAAAVDVGADGDLDVLLVRPQGGILWENRLDEVRPRRGPPEPTPRPTLGRAVARRVAWTDPIFDGIPLLLLVAAWAWARARARAAGSGAALGRPLVACTVLAVVVGSSWAAMDLQDSARQILAGASLSLVLGLGEAEARVTRRLRQRTVAGYRLLERLGSGGMGTVYRARDVATGHLVALKVIHPDLVVAEDERRRYGAEAELGMKVDDPRVVRFLGYGEWNVVEDRTVRPTAFLCMELVSGETLRTWIRESGPLDVGLACAVAREVAAGLHAVHAVGVVHRDIKPENVMLTTEGVVKLTDFGAARTLTTRTLTSSGSVMGTLAYAAPEQIRARHPTAAADLYSLGVMTYEMLAGRLPFGADDPFALIQQVLFDEPPPLVGEGRDVPAGVESAVLRALKKDPGERFPDALAFAAALAPFADPGAAARTAEWVRGRAIRPGSRQGSTPGLGAPVGTPRSPSLWRPAGAASEAFLAGYRRWRARVGGIGGRLTRPRAATRPRATRPGPGGGPESGST